HLNVEKVRNSGDLGSDTWSSFSGGHPRFRAGMSCKPEKDTPARRRSLPAESPAPRRAYEFRTFSTGCRDQKSLPSIRICCQFARVNPSQAASGPEGRADMNVS